MELILFTANVCPRCPAAKRVVDEVGRKYPELEVRVLNIEEGANMQLALRYHVFSTPAIAIGEELVFMGDAPTAEQLLKEIEKRKGARGR